MNGQVLVTVWEKLGHRPSYYSTSGNYSGGGFGGGEEILLDDRRTRITLVILLNAHAPELSLVFRKFKMDSQHVSESKLETWDSCVSPNSSQNFNTVPA